MSDTHKPRKRGVIRRRVVPGVAVALAVLAGLEVGLQFLADGHPDAMVRLLALAAAAGVGAAVAALRRGGSLVVLLACGMAASSAQAGDRDRWYNVTISTAACPTGTPGSSGFALSGVRAWNVTVCPTLGQTITGAGLLRACVFRASPGPIKWALSPRFFWDMSDDGSGNPITSTLANPCVTFEDVQVGVNDGDLLYIYPSTDFGVSGGTAISVYLEGVL